MLGSQLKGLQIYIVVGIKISISFKIFQAIVLDVGVLVVGTIGESSLGKDSATRITHTAPLVGLELGSAAVINKDRTC